MNVFDFLFFICSLVKTALPNYADYKDKNCVKRKKSGKTDVLQ